MRGLPSAGDAFGEYDIIDVLGRGGMGVVYTATKRRLVRTEALKVLSPSWAEEADYRSRFVREAEILASLDSPHIIHIYDYGDVDGTPFISTQLIRGGDLSDYIRDNGPLPAALALEIAAQVASALEDAHASGVIHRDVKPSNVLLRQDIEPFVYLCDFGIARADSGGLTTTGSVVGTWAYLAPERCNGGEASVASDVYSVGCLLWTMLTGHAPYEGSDLAVAMAHLHDPIPQLSGDDDPTRRLNNLLVRSMAKQPDHRLASASDLRQALVDLGSEPARPRAVRPTGGSSGQDRTQVRRSTPPLPAPLPAPPPPPRRRRPLVMVGLVLVALVLAGAVAVGAVLVGRGPKDEAASVRPPAATPRSSHTARQLKKLTRVSYDGGARSQVAIQSADSTGRIEAFGLDSTGAMVAAARRALPGNTERPHRMNGDFDGDGRADAAVFTDDAGGQTVSVASSTGADFAAPRPWGHVDRLTGGGFSTVTGDYDGDGHMDIALVVSEPGTFRTRITVLLSTGKTFRGAMPWSKAMRLIPTDFKFEPGDFNADGRTDIAALQVSGADTGRLLVMLSTGHNLRPAARWADDVIEAGYRDNVKAMAGDFDGDGTSDVLFMRATGDPASGGVGATFLRSTGTSFQKGVSWWTDEQWVLREIWVSVGDFDADGKADVAAIQRSGTVGVTVRLLMSTGSRLSLAAARGSWSEYAHDKTRTLNVVG